MVKAICECVLVTQDIPKIKVISSQSVSIESKGSDSSLKLTFFVSNGNYPLMFYFLRFFRAGTSHRVVGNVYSSLKKEHFDKELLEFRLTERLCLFI